MMLPTTTVWERNSSLQDATSYVGECQGICCKTKKTFGVSPVLTVPSGNTEKVPTLTILNVSAFVLKGLCKRCGVAFARSKRS